MNNLDKIEKEFTPEFRSKVAARTKELIAEELTLRELRKAVDRTQTQVAKILGISQDSVSRLEQRSDLLLSTLRGYVEAMGGELEITVKLPNRGRVILAGISGIGAKRKSQGSRAQRQASLNRRNGTAFGRSSISRKNPQKS